MYLSATLDHFGYGIPKMDSWKEDLWYDKYKFDDWFQALRNRRRTKEIMPHLSVDSDSEDDDHSFMSDGDRPPSPGDGGGAEGSPSGDGQQPEGAGPTGPPDSGNGSEPTHDQTNHLGEDSSGQAPSDAGPNPRREQLPHSYSLTIGGSTIIFDSVGNILGSYDKAFPFKNWDKFVPYNPFAFCKDMASTDFELGGLYDPRSEDIGNIINVAARVNTLKML